MAVLTSVCAVAMVILAHSVVCHRSKLSSLITFAGLGFAGGIVLVAALLILKFPTATLVSVALVYIFGCELYLFLFTLSAASVSANILGRTAKTPVPLDTLRADYSGSQMAMLRIERAKAAGLIVQTGRHLALTENGRRLAQAVTGLRRFFAHDATARQRWSVLAFLVSLPLFLAPITVVALNGWTLTGLYEESVGYRYFYSLRAVYDPPAPPLPQGHSIDLYHRILQRILSLLGYPYDQIFPRIDMFTYLSVAGMQVVNAVALVALLSRMRNGVAVASAIVLWAAFLHAEQFNFVYGLLQPDYPAIEPAFATASAALLIDALRHERLSMLKLGTLLGLAAATKITLAALPLFPIGVAILGDKSSLRSRSKFAASIAVLGGLLCAGLVAAALGFDVDQIKPAARATINMARGGGGVVQTNAFLPWFASRVLGEQGIIMSALCLSPFLTAAFLVDRRTRAAAVVFTLGFAFEVLFLYVRDYFMTTMEATLALLIVGTALIGTARTERQVVAAAIGTAIFLAPLRFGTMGSILESAKLNTAEQRSLPPLSDEGQLWLIPSNYVRPLSIQSAVIKGTLEGRSDLAKRMLPNIDFRFMRLPGTPVEIDRYRHAYFLAKPGETEQQAAARVAAFYKFRWDGWDCAKDVTIASSVIIRCGKEP